MRNRKKNELNRLNGRMKHEKKEKYQKIVAEDELNPID